MMTTRTQDLQHRQFAKQEIVDFFAQVPENWNQENPSMPWMTLVEVMMLPAQIPKTWGKEYYTSGRYIIGSDANEEIKTMKRDVSKYSQWRKSCLNGLPGGVSKIRTRAWTDIRNSHEYRKMREVTWLGTHERVSEVGTNASIDVERVESVAKQKKKPSVYNTWMATELPIYKAKHPEMTHREAFTAVASNWASAATNPKNSVQDLIEEQSVLEGKARRLHHETQSNYEEEIRCSSYADSQRQVCEMMKVEKNHLEQNAKKISQKIAMCEEALQVAKTELEDVHSAIAPLSVVLLETETDLQNAVDQAQKFFSAFVVGQECLRETNERLVKFKFSMEIQKLEAKKVLAVQEENYELAAELRNTIQQVIKKDYIINIDDMGYSSC